MIKEFQLKVLPEIASNYPELKQTIFKRFGIPFSEINHVAIVRRSVDARKHPVKYDLKIRVYINEEFDEAPRQMPQYGNVSDKDEIVIVGAGPAGLFAALKCIQIGRKPVILERGKDVRARRRDLRAINIDHLVNEDSNYCFGEGGAGTYSDGKLYTRSKKRGDVGEVLQLLVAFGAKHDILVDAHPHIGTNKLPQIITNIRNFIIEHGGEIHFNSRVNDFVIQSSAIKGIRTQNGDVFDTQKLILATGHSARDVFELLQRRGILIEAKPFALGVRVEHPQKLIDQIQYHCNIRGQHLPPAPYNVVRQVDRRGVYSFCMCPGGIIAPCATAPGEVVTNGWSPSKRDQPTANSGIVVELKLEDFASYASFGPLAGMEFQKEIEQTAWRLGGRSQKVPAQRLDDFIRGKLSSDLPETSYKPGVTSVELGNVFPDFIHQRLREGLRLIGKSMRGYITSEALVHAPESRTSSPIRIPRNRETLEHPQIKGLYPCGEGAGYAGGIISAAIDGMNCATMCNQNS